jgi:chitin synthase
MLIGSRPGNRGKRDSQMIVMRFLNRVHYNLPMAPLELEMHHQIRNVIGVNPTFYEFCLQIDADTVVADDSATRMVSAFLADTRLIGVCGETSLTNAKHSMVTMIQVYEYYISHNLTKAFESLFGSVTCLPGCYSMYRIRAADTGKPLFVSKEIIEGYSQNRVDTLHMKNLLHLGEDRYLTTLLLKHHPKYKTKYIFRAHAFTVAPDNWTVFLSQRRRWINSTVHNLIELIPLQQLCGFCCFSMRFIVFVDLLSTIVQPVLMAYIIYLIYLLVSQSSVVPITAFILLGAIYGLQAIIFIVRRKWEMVGWMIVYIIATPIFSFALPLYSFWHMDDFTWGNTRIVTGEKGKKLIISDEGKFDPDSIPRKRWEEYQAELWEQQSEYAVGGGFATGGSGSQWDDRSEVSGISYATKSYAGSRPDLLGAYGSRPASQLDLTRNANSRMSLAPTAYGALTGELPHSLELTNMGVGGQPTDDQLLAGIREIIASADLMSVTKKSIKQDLERKFNVGLDSRREYINSAVEAVINGHL